MRHFVLVYMFAVLSRFQTSRSDRRIIDGDEVEPKDGPTVTHQYMVYLMSHTDKFKDWTCGGAIVTKDWVLSSAACLSDDDLVYVVYGYAKKITYAELDTDECVKDTKKRIVKVCTPKLYDLTPENKLNLNKWTRTDIGLAKVEAPFDFTAEVAPSCTWAPKSIDVNKRVKGPPQFTDAFVFGWGSTEKMRAPQGAKETDPNAQSLRTARVTLIDKRKCQVAFKEFEMDEIIEKYMLCSEGTGTIDYLGEEKVDLTVKLLEECSMDDDPQNDHGGPLVCWMGGNQKVIGVSAAFKMDVETRKCVEPYLYTSTYCNAAFIECVIENPARRADSSICSAPAAVKGFDIIERRIRWNRERFEKLSQKKKKALAFSAREDLFVRPVKPLLEVQSVRRKY